MSKEESRIVPISGEMLYRSPLFVMKIVLEGYQLPFICTPTPFHATNQKSALREQQFVEDEIRKLVAGGYVKEILQAPLVCSPLSVVSSDGSKKQLVHDIRHVNKFLWKKKF